MQLNLNVSVDMAVNAQEVAYYKSLVASKKSEKKKLGEWLMALTDLVEDPNWDMEKYEALKDKGMKSNYEDTRYIEFTKESLYDLLHVKVALHHLNQLEPDSVGYAFAQQNFLEKVSCLPLVLNTQITASAVQTLSPKKKVAP